MPPSIVVPPGMPDGTVVTQTVPAGPPGKILALASAAHPLAILILCASAGLTILLVAVSRFWDKIDDQTLFSILGMFFSFLGGVVSGRAMGRDGQRSGDVTTTTVGPALATVKPVIVSEEESGGDKK